MSPGHIDANPTARRFPRVSGDEPEDEKPNEGACKFSPRERG